MNRSGLSHNEYWGKRMEDILRYVDRTDVDMFGELSDIYNRNAQELQKDIFDFYNRFAEDEEISLPEAKRRLRGRDLSDYRANARRYFEDAGGNDELLQRLNEQYESAQVTRLEALHLDLEYQVGMMNGTLQGTFYEHLMSTASYAYRKIAGGRSASTLNRPALEEIVNRPWNSYNYSEDLWANTDKLVKDLKEVFEQGFIRGDSPYQIANEIRGRHEVAQHRAETLVRTDGSNIVTNATAKRYQDAGLKYYRDYVKMDSRTTDICKEVHRKNERKPLSEMEPGVNAAPYHFNCRTGILPDEEELMEVDM